MGQKANNSGSALFDSFDGMIKDINKQLENYLGALRHCKSKRGSSGKTGE